MKVSGNLNGQSEGIEKSVKITYISAIVVLPHFRVNFVKELRNRDCKVTNNKRLVEGYRLLLENKRTGNVEPIGSSVCIFFVSGEMRDIKLFHAINSNIIDVARNNLSLQFFRKFIILKCGSKESGKVKLNSYYKTLSL